MSAEYQINKTGFSDDAENYHASVHYNEVMDEDDIIDMMMLNGSPFTRADTQAIINKYHETINIAARNGWQVNTRNVRYGVTIKGVFTGPQDRFDSSRHKIVPHVQPGLGYKEALQNGVTLAKKTSYKKRPELNEYANLYSGGSRSELTPGHNARLLGSRLNFDPTDADQGLFIVPVDAAGLLNMSGAVKVEEFTDITPKVLTFRVPDGLSPGFYTLEVRAKIGKSGLRVGRLEAVLTVV
ncbi:MAG: DUF4469 domain-containing protein [Anaerolineae bacterium]|nr:DUF4469 domain-containing protein [Anaerolineae bacterium]